MIGLLIGNTANTRRPTTGSAPAQTVENTSTVRLDPPSRAAAEQVIARFVRTGVLRRDLEAAWSLASPALKRTTSRTVWLRGDLPGVAPFPASAYAGRDIRFLYADSSTATFDVVVLAKPSTGQGTLVSTVVLRSRGERWLVDSWATTRVLPTVTDDPGESTTTTATLPAPAGLKGRLSPLWFIVPAILLGLIAVVPVAVLVGNRMRDRREERRWREQARR